MRRNRPRVYEGRDTHHLHFYLSIYYLDVRWIHARTTGSSTSRWRIHRRRPSTGRFGRKNRLGHDPSPLGQVSTRALLRLPWRNFQIQFLDVIADEFHVVSQHGKLTDDLNGRGRLDKFHALGQGIELVGDDFNGGAFFDGVAEGDYLASDVGWPVGWRWGDGNSIGVGG